MGAILPGSSVVRDTDCTPTVNTATWRAGGAAGACGAEAQAADRAIPAKADSSRETVNQ
ncbi:MAG: hypothetical protein Kow00109_24380 [Acidobacteriota bacterium]